MSEKLKRHSGQISRREFLRFSGLSLAAPLLGLNLENFLDREIKYEPERIYPLLTSLKLSETDQQIKAEYNLPGKKTVYVITEKELLAQFQGAVITGSEQLFANHELNHFCPYYVSQAVNLDPKLYFPHKLHLGTDFVTTDPHKRDTVFLNPIRAKYLGPVTIGRMSVDTPVMQMVDAQGKNLEIQLGGLKCAVIALYGHLLPVGKFHQDQIIEVGAPLGDVTADLKVGGSSGPHTHIEMIAIPLEAMKRVEQGQTTIQQVLLQDEYDPLAQNVYLDSNFIWKFMPGSLRERTGLDQYYWDATKNLATWEKCHGK